MRVFVIAGEPSGDRLGGSLMAGLRAEQPEIAFAGVGGPDMQAQGLQSLFAMSELSLIGIAEILPKYRHLKRRIAQTAQAVLDFQPDVLITIDSPDFCLRVARIVRAERSIRTVHYVAPSVWAWRPGRADKMAKVIDHVLALLPFEPPYMEAAGMACDFVGHPIATEPAATDAESQAFRAKHGLGADPVLIVLPGSRRGEVNTLCPIFGDALRRYLTHHPDTRVVVPAAGPVFEQVRSLTAPWPGQVLVLDPNQTSAEEKRAAIGAGTVGLAASGTVSLELSLAEVPMVVAYKPNWLTWQIAKRMVRVDTVTLVNLVTETRVVPECLGPDCNGARIAEVLQNVTANPTSQKEAMAETLQKLGQGGTPPGLRAAQAVLARM